MKYDALVQIAHTLICSKTSALRLYLDISAAGFVYRCVWETHAENGSSWSCLRRLLNIVLHWLLNLRDSLWLLSKPHTECTRDQLSAFWLAELWRVGHASRVQCCGGKSCYIETSTYLIPAFCVHGHCNMHNGAMLARVYIDYHVYNVRDAL